MFCSEFSGFEFQPNAGFGGGLVFDVVEDREVFHGFEHVDRFRQYDPAVANLPCVSVQASTLAHGAEGDGIHVRCFCGFV